jgi:ATP-dependent helicase/nuclease subunit B
VPLKVFCGSFQPSLENALVERVTSLAPGPGRPVLVVAPSRNMSNRLQRLLALEHGLPLLNVRFHLFYSLALELLQDTAPGRFSVVADDLFYDKLVDRLLDEHFGPRSVRARRLSVAYRETLRDLEEANVDPDQFLEFHFEDLIRSDNDRRRVTDLLTVQKAFRARLNDTGILPPYGVVREAMKAVRSGQCERLAQYPEIIFYGFYDLNGVDADFFQAVARAYPTTLFFPYRHNHPAFAFSQRFYELNLYQGGGVPVHLEDSTRVRALGPALDRLFDPGPSPAVAPDPAVQKSVRFLSVSGLRDEAWRVAKEILALHESPSPCIPFSDMGIVARTLDPYRGVLCQVLREHGIPFSLEGGQPLLRYPLAKLCLGLLTLRRMDFPAQTVQDIIGSPYFSSDALKNAEDPAQRLFHWRRMIERLAIHSGWSQWQGKLSPWTKQEFELYPHLMAEGSEGHLVPREDTAALWELLRALNIRLDPKTPFPSWRAMAEAARDILERHIAVPTDKEDQKVWDTLLACLEDLKRFDHVDALSSSNAGSEPWSLFLEALHEKLERATLDVSEDHRGVRVMDAMEARGESFRVLFLLGLNEGLFPRQVREDPLLQDPLRYLFHQPAGYWILPKLAGYDEEKLLFTLMASAASERLYCFFARADDAGQAQVPSIYLRELARACGVDLEEQAELVPRQPFAKLEKLPASRLCPKEISLLVAMERAEPPANGATPREVSAFFKPLGLDGEPFQSALERLPEFNRSGEPGGLDGRVGPPSKFMRRLESWGLSPTALDSFSRCPFQFYASRVMGLVDPEEPSERGDLAAWVRGKIYHEILQRFYEKLKTTGYWSRPADTPWAPELHRSIELIFQKFHWQELGVYPVLWESIKRQMTWHLNRFVAMDISEIRASGLRPAYFEEMLRSEVQDGDRGSGPRLVFHGQPDRVDRDEEGRRARVVDYKSRWPASRGSLEKMVLKSLAHQPPVYLELVKNDPRLSSPDTQVEGAFYYILEESPEITNAAAVHRFSADAWKQIRAPFFDRIALFTRHIAQGDFIIIPNEEREGHCHYCAFSLVCRKSHGMTRHRAEHSRQRAEYDALGVESTGLEDAAPAFEPNYKADE